MTHNRFIFEEGVYTELGFTELYINGEKRYKKFLLCTWETLREGQPVKLGFSKKPKDFIGLFDNGIRELVGFVYKKYPSFIIVKTENYNFTVNKNELFCGDCRIVFLNTQSKLG